MINIHLIGNTVYDVTPYVEKGSVSWGESGDNEVQIDLKSTFAFSQNLFQSNYQYNCVVLDGGRQVFNGKLSSNGRVNDTSSLTAVGDYYKTQEIEDYTEFWSYAGTEDFYLLTSDNSRAGAVSGELVSQVTQVAPDFYAYENDGSSIRMSLKKSTSIPSLSGIAAVFELPQICQNNMYRALYTLKYQVPSGFLIVVQVKDINGGNATNLTNISTTTTSPASISTYQGIGIDARTIYLALRNSTGGTYTSTQEDGFWSVVLTDVRLLATSDDVIVSTITASTSAGSDIVFTPASMNGINVGDRLYIVNECITVKSITASTFTADAINAHTNGNAFAIARNCATNIIEDIANRVGASVIMTTTPDKDIPNALYNNQSAFSILEDLKQTSLHDDTLSISVQNGNMIVVEHGATSTYYADANDIQLSKEYDSLVARANSQYTTNTSIDRVAGSVVDTRSVSLNSLRTKRIESNYTISGAALNDAYQYLTTNSRVTIKSDFKVTKLYNGAGGIVDYPIMGSQVIFRNIIPELLGIADYSYSLKSATLDLVTGEKEYVIGEYLDTLSTLVANI